MSITAKQSKLIHSDIIEAIKQQTDLVDIVERYITLKKRGKDYIGLCPFHEERTPSFTVSPSKQFYHCFGCGVGGDAIHFLMQLNQNSFQDVLLELARDYSIRVRYEDGSFDEDLHPPVRPSIHPRKRQPEPNYLPAPMPDGEIELATLPTPVTTPQRQHLPHPAKPNVETWVTRFLYSDDQWVDRIEWIDTTKPKGYDKITLPYHIDCNGQTINAKGSKPWLPYRWNDVLQHAVGKWILGLEGETCVEIARLLQLVAFTLQGGSWSHATIHSLLVELKAAGIAGLFYFPDHDNAGRKKAEIIAQAAAQAGLPCIVLNPLEIWPQMMEKGDIVDWYSWARSQAMQPADMTAHLVTVAKNTAVAVRESQEQASLSGGSGGNGNGSNRRGGGSGNGGDGNQPPNRDNKLITHPAWTPLTPEQLLGEINLLIHRGLSDSEISLAIPHLALRSGYTSPAVWKIYQERLKDIETTENRLETAALVDLLLKAHAASVPLHSVLPLGLAEPLAKYAGWLSIRPEVVLLTFLTTISGLHHTATTSWLNQDWDFEVKPNLFTAIVAPPSQKKSPVLKTIAKKPLRVLERKARQELKAAKAKFNETEQYYNSLSKEQKQQQFPQGLPPAPPDRRKVYAFTDATTEGLRNQIQAYPHQGLMALPDELARLLKSANKYRGGKGSDEEDLLSQYDGGGETSLRAGGLAGDFDNLLLSVLGSIQPGVLQKMMTDCHDENGKWARFQFVVQPLSPSVMSTDGGSFDLTPMLASLYEKVNNLPPQEYKPDQEAFTYYCSIYNEFERRRCRESHPGLSAAWGKAEGRMGKLACNLHVVHELMAGRAPRQFIPKARYEEAFAITMFSMQQVFSLYNELGDSNALASHLTKVILLSQRKGEIVARDVQLLYDSKVRPTPDTVRSWFRELEAMNKGKTAGTGRNLRFTVNVENVESNVERDSTLESYINQELQANVENVEECGVFSEKLSYPDLTQNTVETQIKKSEIFPTNSTSSTMASSVDEMLVSVVETSSTPDSTTTTEPDPDDDPTPPPGGQPFPRTERYEYQGQLGLWVLQIQFNSCTHAEVTYTSPAPESTSYTQSLTVSDLIEVGQKSVQWLTYLETLLQQQRSSADTVAQNPSIAEPRFSYCGKQSASGLVEINGRRAQVQFIQPGQIVVRCCEDEHSQHPNLLYVKPLSGADDWQGGIAVRIEDLQLLD